MEKEMWKDKSDLMRLNLLSDNCAAIETITYPHQFSEEEMSEKKTDLANIDLSIDSLESEKREFMQFHKSRTKPLVENKKGLLLDIGRQFTEVTDKCYKYIDRETREVGYYNGNGDLVKTRPIQAQELQKTMSEEPGFRNTGTDN